MPGEMVFTLIDGAAMVARHLPKGIWADCVAAYGYIETSASASELESHLCEASRAHEDGNSNLLLVAFVKVPFGFVGEREVTLNFACEAEAKRPDSISTRPTYVISEMRVAAGTFNVSIYNLPVGALPRPLRCNFSLDES
ncbi:hypothetical protein FZEAL_10268 [Fusarium zealandicum]|uniref:Uncharacterized protein n=1 Tax=Fusarium zealandicum TaxID=1053134 RepID=A0A8H4U3X1_9HYPO|nr:hypothetical protein FZEAL_10268 [Fusarium zealandicum]